MAGHSKWASIKHKKAANDAKRGKLWSKLLKEVSIAARLGGGDPEMNPRLRTAVQSAKASNVPNDTITRAVQKGTGELEGVDYEEATYEAYGPAGVAIMIEIMTDNKNRAISEIRYILSRNGGNLGERGCVAWIFNKCGLILIDRDSVDEESLLTIALEAGAEDINTSGDVFEVISPVEVFEDVRSAIEMGGARITHSEIAMLPQTTVALEDKEARQMLRLMDALEDNDDVQKVYANFDIPDEILDAA